MWHANRPTRRIKALIEPPKRQRLCFNTSLTKPPLWIHSNILGLIHNVLGTLADSVFLPDHRPIGERGSPTLTLCCAGVSENAIADNVFVSCEEICIIEGITASVGCAQLEHFIDSERSPREKRRLHLCRSFWKDLSGLSIPDRGIGPYTLRGTPSENRTGSVHEPTRGLFQWPV